METGPKTCVCLSGQKVIFGPEKFVTVPPQHYVTIMNPVVVDKEGNVVVDANGQAVLRHGDTEVRTERPPFALFPGEKLEHAVRPLPTVAINNALRMEAMRDIVTSEGEIIHRAGEEWLEIGPKVLIPHPGARSVSTVSNFLIAPNEALHMRATRDLVDFDGKARIAGEEYLVRKVGSYLPILNETVLGKITARVLTPKTALLVRAKLTFTDQFGKRRKVGQEWLVTSEDTESFIPCVEEEIVESRNIVTLSNREYCVVSSPLNTDTGLNQIGMKETRRGPQSFFLQPGETLYTEPTQVIVLREDNALELIANEKFQDVLKDGKVVVRQPGEVWRLVGPQEYWMPLEAQLRRYINPVLRLPSLGMYIFDAGTVFAAGAGLLILFVLLCMYLF